MVKIQNRKQPFFFRPFMVYFRYLYFYSQSNKSHFLGNHSGLDCDVTMLNLKVLLGSKDFILAYSFEGID